jgi:hypothetical protein
MALGTLLRKPIRGILSACRAHPAKVARTNASARMATTGEVARAPLTCLVAEPTSRSMLINVDPCA